LAFNLSFNSKTLGILAALGILVIFPYVVPPAVALFMGYGLVTAIAALGYNLLLGYTGLLSFGHAAYFGTGAYAAAFLFKYLGIRSIEVYLAAGMLSAGVLAIIFGTVCVRHTRIFFAILSQSLSLVLWSLMFKFYWVTGGTDGLRVPSPTLLGIDFSAAERKVDFLIFTYYYYALVIFLISAVVMWVIVNSAFGKTLQAIRDNETRARFLGIRVRRYRWLAFVISGIYGGLSGALWAPINGLTTPDILYWLYSGEIIFQTLIGGFQSFAGPIVGSILFTYIKTYAIGATIYWQLVMGIVIVAIIVFLPTGVVGGVNKLAARLRR